MIGEMKLFPMLIVLNGHLVGGIWEGNPIISFDSSTNVSFLSFSLTPNPNFRI